MAKKPTKRAPRHRCKAEDCRRLAKGGMFCGGSTCLNSKISTSSSAGDDSLETVLDTVVGLKWRALDSEIRNHLQGVRIAELEIEKATRDYQIAVAGLNDKKRQVKNEYNIRHKEYRDLVNEIAEEYDLDPERMSIDSDTFVVRDLRD